MLPLLASLSTLLLQPDVEAVRAAERARIEVMASVMPAVCSVMAVGAPGGGSGVLIDAQGFVLTNFHVVGKPETKVMRVGLPDGLLYDADVLGIDPGSDLAVLCLRPSGESRDFPWAPLGDSDRLLVGEQVFAMGNPFLLATDFQPTVTFGIVSGTHRYQPGGNARMGVYPDCIQVDAPVNPGNSGGPLFNMRGEVVGINGRISVGDRGRVNVGVGFAIASRQIRNFLADLLAGRHAEHGTLDLNAWFMRAPNGDRHGVFVQAIFDDSRVTEFGMKLGDEITTFDGTAVRSANQLATLVGVLPADAEVSLGFRPALREGFGGERTIRFRLRRLDTGSSRDPERLASEQHRRLAARMAMRALAPAGDDDAGATVVLRGDDDTVRLCRRGSTATMWSSKPGERYVVPLEGDEPARKVTGDGTPEPTSPELRESLRRDLTTNPWLHPGGGLRRLLADALLEGGIMVAGQPATVLRLPGDGERRVYLFWDGRPAGYGYRSPARGGYVEWLAVGDGQLRGDFDREPGITASMELAPPPTDPDPLRW